MPRKARVDAAGALQHIIIRGIERRKIYRDDGDRNNFLGRLGSILLDTRTQCYAWALIPNHAHLLLRTGLVPIATVMRRLLTGYAVSFNLKYRRHGQLFQNRYKSILCQENPYLKELVRYIHLNPLRAGLIADFKSLDKYAYCGHSAVMGKTKRPWQKVDYVLRLFDINVKKGRKQYRRFVEKGIADGRKPHLVGGGLIRSMGGWYAVKALRKAGVRMKADQRILGDGDFVEAVLKESNEQLTRKYSLEAQGYNLKKVIERVSMLLNIEPKEIMKSGKYPQVVVARSLVCYWANKELGMTTIELAKRFNLSQPTISKSVKRGEIIAIDNGFMLINDDNVIKE
jgi:putative transposase